MFRRRLFLVVPLAVIAVSALLLQPRPTMREQIEREVPGMHLVARKVDPTSGEISYLYTGRGDSEAISSRH